MIKLTFMTYDSLIKLIKTLPVGGKVLTYLSIIFALAALIFFASCSTSRHMSVTIDKAEKVDVHLKDSIGTLNPFFN